MEANLLEAAASSGLGSSSGVPSPSSVGQFEALLKQPPTSGAVSPSFVSHRYVEDLVGPGDSTLRPVAMPADWVSAGQKFMDEFKTQKAEISTLFEPTEGTSPYMKRFQAQMDGLVKVQESLTQFSLVMKGIELSSSSAQQLLKLQG
jgi:hypothetical protein